MSKEDKIKANQSDNPVGDSLQEVLRDSYSLFLATHNYHWNVEGPNFHSLHVMFEEQYTELFQALDEIAERARALDVYALPFEDGSVARLLKEVSNPLTEEYCPIKRARIMVSNLVKLNKKVVSSLQSTKKVSKDNSDDETEDMMIERIQIHQKAIWMLSSIIKGHK